MISAVICTYNREKYLSGLLKSILNQTVGTDQFEIVLINNNSTDNTENVAMEFKANHPSITFRYFVETNQGLSFARNRGVKEAKGEYITFLDDDAFLSENYFEKIIAFFEKHPSSVAVGSKILLHYEDNIPNWENKYLNSLMGFYNPGDEEFVYNSDDYPRGSNMSFRATIFEKVGYFNTNLGRVGRNLLGGEEKDLFQRIYKHKSTVHYIPDAIVYHCVPNERTTSEFIKKQAIGTGSSEWQRVKDEGGIAKIKRLGQEIVKWIASFMLFFVYLVKRKPAKGIMIMRFRFWVTKGILGGK